MWIGSAVRGVLVLYCVFINASASSECDLCRDIVKEFKSGLAKTEKSGFAGGNTNWEEKSLGKWKTSETRLVEIVDNHVCKHDSKACHAFIEKHEEALEDWYFNIYKDQDNSDGLDEHLCIDFAKVCCPPGTFSRNCDQMCPMDEGGVCGGRGKCDGDGTRSGLGVCKCDDGYQGKFCDICSDKYYQEATGNIKLCKKCDVSCEDTCTGEGPNGCDDCADGYTWDSNKGCLDDNECETEETCIEGKYCVNTDGSHECKACSGDCKACIGGKAADCTLCADGYQRQNTEEETSICEDMDECQSESQLCKNIEGAACVNTVGSFDCKCSAENHVIEGDKCVEKPADPLQESQDEEDANKKSDDDKKSKIDSSNKSSKDEL